MKKIMFVLLASGLLLILSQAALAAVHPGESKFSNWSSIGDYYTKVFTLENDKWFDAAKAQPSLSGGVGIWKLGNSDNLQVFDLNYIQNEQTFAGIIYDNLSSGSLVTLNGSYLFNFGLFIGANYTSQSGSDSMSYNDMSVGYRFNLGDNGFIALSGDCNSDSENTESRFGGYELDTMYYLSQAKLFGEIYQPKDSDSTFLRTSDPYLMAGADLAVNDQLTVGFKYETVQDINSYTAGLTWSNDYLLLNGKTGKELISQQDFYAVGGTYKFNENWSMGVTYGKYQDLDPGYVVKVAYKTGMMNFSFTYNKEWLQRRIGL